MSKISEKISSIFGFKIKEGEWEKYLSELDKEGEPTRKNMAELLFAVCEELERLEKLVEEKGVLDVKRTTKGRNSKVNF